MATIIELSYNNASQKNLTSDWTNSFQQQIVLNPNDGLVTKLCLLDYSSTGQYSNIEIPQDLNVSMTCGFFYTVSDPEFYNPDVTPPPNKLDFDGIELFKYYVARDTNNNLIKSTKTFTIKKGVYDINELCENITRTLTTINVQDIGKSIYFDNNPNEYFYRSTQIGDMAVNVYNFTEQIQNNVDEGDVNAQREWILYAEVKPQNIYQLQPFEVGQEVIFALQYKPAINNLNATIIAIDKVAGTFQLKYYEDSFGDSVYDPNLVGVVPPKPWPYYYAIMYAKDTTPIKFYDPENFDPTNYITLATRSYMGASQCALVYNDDNDGKFSFKYMHSPVYDSQSNESVSILNVFGSTFYYYLAQSGIFWTDLQPKELWEDIFGFSLSDMIISDNTTTHNLNQLFVLGQNITSNLLTYDNIFDKPSKTTNPPKTDTPYYTTSQDTFKIVGLQQQTSFVSPYFIVQILGLGNVNMIDDGKTYQTIAQICSKEYDNNGVITSFSDSVPFFYNTSLEPMLISSLRVRILDGTTKKPTLILGQNNNIFIQIVKA